MKFLASLFGSATPTAPTTLDQARTLFATVKANAEKIGGLFTAAKVDLDALLAKGDSALSEHIDGLVAAARTETTTALAATHTSALAAKDTEIASLRDRATKSEARNSEIVGVLTANKITFAADAKPEVIGAAITSRVSMAGGELLAKAGLREFPEQVIEADPTKPTVVKAVNPKLPPLARLTAKLSAQAAAARN